MAYELEFDHITIRHSDYILGYSIEDKPMYLSIGDQLPVIACEGESIYLDDDLLVVEDGKWVLDTAKSTVIFTIDFAD